MNARELRDIFWNAQVSYQGNVEALVHFSLEDYIRIKGYLQVEANTEYWSEEAMRKENEE